MGTAGEAILTEDSPPGRGFLAEVCRAWEAATEPARQHGMRVVQLRLGVVLSAAGGALAKMLPPFRLGLGGVLGSGQQYMSWIALDDVVGAIQHAIVTDALQGPTNAVAPRAVTNQEFTKTLGKVLGRPDGHSAASICRASHVWGDGRRAVTGECPRTAHQTPGLGVPVPLP